jgi:hypothetical protein
MYYSSTLPLIWVSVSVKRVKSFRVLLVSPFRVIVSYVVTIAT